jgi:YidC/Oxa1 family membrane protein insertase
MEIRRIIVFVTLSLLIVIGWQAFVLPRLMQPQKPAAQAEKKAPEHPAAEKADARPAVEEVVERELPDNPQKRIQIGSLDPDSGYFMQATLTTTGAAVEQIQLNDPRYRDLDNRDVPLRVVRTVVGGEGKDQTVYRTFQTEIEQINEELKEFGKTLDTVEWEIVREGDQAPTSSSVTFGFQMPGGSFEVLKHYRLHRVDPETVDLREARETRTEGYMLDLALTVRNLGSRPQTVGYVLQGPVGVPLESLESTRKFRDLKAELVFEDGSTSTASLAVSDIAEQAAEGKLEEWRRPFLYAGVDVQYFAALVTSGEEPRPSKHIEVIQPVLLDREEETTHSDISLQLVAKPIELAAAGADGDTFEHHYGLYAGPKRESLLAPIYAEEVVDYGWFGFVSRAMLAILNFFYDTLGIPYGIAIICLTILVRGALFPLSYKQAQSAKKMKDLQPKIAELKKKYGNDREKFAKAQMELFRKHNYNIFSGCLPIILQLPIFIGLYNALNASVDLRMAEFLWIDNLAAPDRLFRLPFSLPFLGEWFNLLPIITVALFIVQQKMFMPPPPPDDEQAQLQHKMMKFMMIFMGFLFYHVPAGLCIYFIASSLWGMAERKALDLKKSEAGPEPSTAAATGAEPRPTGNGAPAHPGRKKKSNSRR